MGENTITPGSTPDSSPQDPSPGLPTPASTDPRADAQAAATAAAEAAAQAQAELTAAIAKAEQAAADATAAAEAASSAAQGTADSAPATTEAASQQAPPTQPDTTAEPEHETEQEQEQTAASQQQPDPEPNPEPTEPTGSPAGEGPLTDEQVSAVRNGYTVEGTALTLGALVNGEALPDVQINIPLGMLNRHGLVAGATGTGKTKTLQVLAEQIAALGVPVFAADIKGDLSGVATPGVENEKLLARTRGIGQDWTPRASVTEYFTLGGMGIGVPIRASVTSFGPVLLAKVLGLNATQESSLGLIFHYAEENGLALIDLADLQSILAYLTSDEGKAEIKLIGGLSSQTVGVIQRSVIGFADQGADVFFGEPAINPLDFITTAADGSGVISLLEVPGVQDKPALFSTFLMYVLGELFAHLPEVGDQDKPKLVFFFDEAHLLFADASKAFREKITQTVRLIRSKGVGIFFVTQTPKDVPAEVLAQLGSRIQHALRAHTPDDAKALKATVSTYPTSGYALGEVLQSLATGEAIVTVLNEKGAPSPVAWTRMRAPQGSMDPTPEPAMLAAAAASPLMITYGTPVDAESAKEVLEARAEAAAEDAEAAELAAERAKQAEKVAAEQAKEAVRLEKERIRLEERQQRERDAKAKRTAGQVSSVITSAARTTVNALLRGLFRKN